MNTPELAAVLEECLRLARSTMPGTIQNRQEFDYSKGMLPPEISTLLQEAVDMKWPFVEEKWQYKHSVSSEDKVNIEDLISQHLPQLMAFLRSSITAAEAAWAMSVIFLVDRFLYWLDGSHILLKIAKALHKRNPETPIAPQIVIRQARVYLNTGKLQKAEYILSNLISHSGATGCWRYHRDSDRVLVQAVSVQVRGQVLQKLGLWLEAIELIWASLVGFHVLPLPDKKGIGTSLGLLANILVSMTDQDFAKFQKKPQINLGFLGDCSHRLLCAAQAAKLAAVYSQFVSLYVLTHIVTRGTCLLSYSFSKDCPPGEKQTYVALAKEAFENGLLTKSETALVTSKQELHTFLKAAHCLVITNKWMFGPSKEVTLAMEACQEAYGLFYSYCFQEDSNKDELCSQIMGKVHYVKSLLKVKPFTNSDPRSFIPDSYRAMEDRHIPFTLNEFTILMEGFQKHHKSVCEALDTPARKGNSAGQCTHDHCLTAFQTRTESLATELLATAIKSSEPWPKSPDNADKIHVLGPKITQVVVVGAQKETIDVTLDSEEQHQCDHLRPLRPDEMTKNMNHTPNDSGSSQGSSGLGSSWLHVPENTGPFVKVDPSCCTETDNNDVFDELRGRKSRAEPFGNNENGQKATNIANESKDLSFHRANAANTIHQSNNAHFSPASQSGAVIKGANTQNQSSFELCTTLETEDENQSGDEMEAVGREEKLLNEEKHKMAKASSGSLSSSLGSSWQSVSFFKSSQNGDLGDISEHRHIIDQNCNTVATEDDPDSSFECINPTSPPPISDRGPSSSFQPCVKDQSTVEIARDLEESVLSHHLSGIALTNKRADAAKNSKYNLIDPLHEEQPRSHQLEPSLLSTQPESFELLEFDQPELPGPLVSAEPVQKDRRERDPSSSDKVHDFPIRTTCSKGCFQGCTLESVVLTQQDYRSLLSGVCQGCLLRRLPHKPLKLKQYGKAYSALALKYSKATDMWTGCETSVYVGELLNVAVKGGQRQAFRVQFLHQEQLLGSYVGKEYLKERTIHAHLEDVERQMTAQYYVNEFNKCLYASDITTQIFYIPSEVLLITEADTIVACVSVEPFMLGDFVKLTNNTTKIDRRYSTTEYGIAFGHFTYEFSNRKEVVVDLQGWVTANGKGLVYLTDPQIHSLIKPKSSSNFHQSGIVKFLQEQHGDACSPVCITALQRLRETQHSTAVC